MMTRRVTIAALAAGLWMTGLCYADEASVRTYLSSDKATAYLQQGNARLELMQPGKDAPSDAVVFQKFIGDIPLHGARVFVIENADGTVAQVFDDPTDNLVLRQGPVNIAQDLAVDILEGFLPQAIDSTVEQVWFRKGNEAVLAWEVTTSLADMGLPASPTHFEAVIDAETGIILSERQIDTKTYLPGSPEAEAEVYPRIVINNAIGAQGSRDYAAPFDAVIRVGGCTGTLIAPNVVLSARHCGIGAGDLVRFGDNSNSTTFTITVQSSSLPDGGGSLLDGGDVSIHVLNGTVPGNIAEPMRLIDETEDLEGMVCATLGYGWNGLGSTGHGGSADGFRWGGENIIDVYGSPPDRSGSNIISTDFDNGTSGANQIFGSSATPLEFEATTAPGDSGGPVLVRFGNEWVIAGVLSGGTTNTASTAMSRGGPAPRSTATRSSSRAARSSPGSRSSSPTRCQASFPRRAATPSASRSCLRRSTRSSRAAGPSMSTREPGSSSSRSLPIRRRVSRPRSRRPPSARRTSSTSSRSISNREPR
jgi:hypothetical protein